MVSKSKQKKNKELNIMRTEMLLLEVLRIHGNKIINAEVQ